VYDRVEYKYNRQGERTERKDQNGTVHAYEFDALGRVVHDRVTTLGTNIDGAVRRTSTTYEVRGMIERITHYDNATVGSGSVVNEVVLSYNDLGMLDKEYQEHEGAQDANTLYVQYLFDTTASGGKYTRALRPSSVRYPNGRLVHFTYGATDSVADVLHRLDALQDDSGGSPGMVLASYKYLGLGTIVSEDYEQPDVRLESFFNSVYGGWDRFGRVIDQRWYDYGATAERDRFTYGYDRASNRTYRENTVASAKDEYYSYDDIQRLVTFDRGDLNAGKTAISGTPVKEEDWGLDMTGNWTDFVQKTSGTTDLNQDRAHNAVNELTGITESVGTAWIDPVQDRAGNLTTLPKPSSLSTGLTCTWDAWNRLVEVKQGAVVMGRYEYDALGRRVKSHVDSQSPGNPNGVDAYVHFFYNSDRQELESRVSASENTGPESLQPTYQYVWSRRYLDAPVLRDKNTDADGLCDDERVYYLGDANFNITTLVNTGGDAVERYVYTPYGALTIYDATWTNVRSASSYANAYTYTGRQLDAETGLYYYRARYLHTQLGRFCSRDPLKYFGGMNRYGYVSNGPLNRTDPGGLEEVQYIPGRGKFCNLSYQVPYGSNSNQLGASFSVAWHADLKAFQEAEPSCCTSIGFVQVYRSKASFWGLGFWMGSIKSTPNWTVDKEIPYPYGSTAPNVAALPPGRIGMQDFPYYTKKGWGWWITDVKMEFETCAVCLTGAEGIVATTTYGVGYTLRGLDRMTVYGCVKWSWGFTLRNDEYDLEYSLSVPHTDSNPEPDKFMTTVKGPFEGEGPTPEFKSAVKAYYYSMTMPSL
jgi:RHS repeat-associated protein